MQLATETQNISFYISFLKYPFFLSDMQDISFFWPNKMGTYL